MFWRLSHWLVLIYLYKVLSSPTTTGPVISETTTLESANQTVLSGSANETTTSGPANETTISGSSNETTTSGSANETMGSVELTHPPNNENVTLSSESHEFESTKATLPPEVSTPTESSLISTTGGENEAPSTSLTKDEIDKILSTEGTQALESTLENIPTTINLPTTAASTVEPVKVTKTVDEITSDSTHVITTNDAHTDAVITLATPVVNVTDATTTLRPYFPINPEAEAPKPLVSIVSFTTLEMEIVTSDTGTTANEHQTTYEKAQTSTEEATYPKSSIKYLPVTSIVSPVTSSNTLPIISNTPSPEKVFFDDSSTVQGEESTSPLQSTSTTLHVTTNTFLPEKVLFDDSSTVQEQESTSPLQSTPTTLPGTSNIFLPENVLFDDSSTVQGEESIYPIQSTPTTLPGTSNIFLPEKVLFNDFSTVQGEESTSPLQSSSTKSRTVTPPTTSFHSTTLDTGGKTTILSGATRQITQSVIWMLLISFSVAFLHIF